MNYQIFPVCPEMYYFSEIYRVQVIFYCDVLRFIIKLIKLSISTSWCRIAATKVVLIRQATCGRWQVTFFPSLVIRHTSPPRLHEDMISKDLPNVSSWKWGKEVFTASILLRSHSKC